MTTITDRMRPVLSALVDDMVTLHVNQHNQKNLTDLELKLRLLKMQIECLRSVLSEYDGDKSHFSQMIKADTIQALLEMMK